MQNADKIFPPRFDVLDNRRKSLIQAKAMFFKALPTIFKTGPVGCVLLILQVFLVGGFDRLGVSPKVSLLVSSLFFAAFFGGLAIIGGIKRNVSAVGFVANFKTRPICKMLIIRRKKQGIKI